MRKSKGIFIFMLLAALVMALASCGGSGSGAGADDAGAFNGTTTSVAGRVALSSASASSAGLGKPGASISGIYNKYKAQKAALEISGPSMEGQDTSLRGKAAAYQGKADTMLGKTLVMRGTLQSLGDEDLILSGAVVQLFDAEHPEFIYPIAETLTDENGDFIVQEMRYADKNNPLALTNSATYENGDPIPAGRYSMIASKFDANIGKLFVAVQAIVKNYAGPVTGNNLVAQDSDSVPEVLTMFALYKNPLTTIFGKDNAGNVIATVPKDSDVQITFSQAMARLSVIETAKLINTATGQEVPGQWKVSANLLSAAFHPANDLTIGTVYKLMINGGKPTPTKQTAKNVFGRSISQDEVGYFMAGPDQTARPRGFQVRPESTPDYIDNKLEGGQDRIRVTAPIRIEASKPLDINYFDVTVTPSIGEIPTVLYLGTNLVGRYVYDIIPSEPLKLNSDYSIWIDGAKDLEGLPIIPFEMQFVTESFTNGVDQAAPVVVQQAQAQAKDVFGKWLRAFSEKNVTMLTNYMTGDFIWLPNEPGSENSEDDLNRDGRLSSYEFTRMLKKWFSLLKACDSLVTGDVTSMPGIEVTSTTNPAPTQVSEFNRARMTFNLDVTSGNYSNPACQETGPPSNMYLELKRINGAWYVSRGADQAPVGGASLQFPPVREIELITPNAGEELALPFSGEVRPAFKWTGIANIETYAVVVIDARSDWNERGWVALVDGDGTADIDMKVNFNPQLGQAGNTFILNVERTGWFREQLSAIKPGGRYIWSVIGFSGLDANAIRYEVVPSNMTLGDFVTGTSRSRDFMVEGQWLDLTVKVKYAGGLFEAPYDQYLGGYDLTTTATGASINQADLEIFTPSGSTSGKIRLDGAGQGEYYLEFNNGYATLVGGAPVVIDLFNGRNELEICDNWDDYMWECVGLTKRFNIITSGGILPRIQITSIIDNTTGTSLGTIDSWGSLYNATVEYIDIEAIVTGSFNNSTMWRDTYVDVYYDNHCDPYYGCGWSDYVYYSAPWNSQFGFQDVPLRAGWNSVQVSSYFYDTSAAQWKWYSTRVNIEVGPAGGVKQSQVYQPVTANFADGAWISNSYTLDVVWPGALFDMGSRADIGAYSLDMDTNDTSNCPADSLNGVPTGKLRCGRFGVYHFIDTGQTQDFVRIPPFSDETGDGYLFDDGTWEIREYISGTGYVIVNSGYIDSLPVAELMGGMNVLYVNDYLDGQYHDQLWYLFSSNGKVYEPPFTVDVEALLPNTATMRLNYQYVNYVDYTSTDVDTIRVTGFARDIMNGTTIINGVYFKHYTSGSSMVKWADVNPDGSFTADIDLVTLYNDIYLRTCAPPHDLTACNSPHEYYDVHVYTEAGKTPPKYVSIDGPVHNSKLAFDVNGATVFGHLDLANFVGAPSNNWYVQVYDYNWVSGDPVPRYQYFYNGTTFNYDIGTGSFYFQPNFQANNMYRIWVEARDSGTGQYHGNYIYINNNSNNGEYYYKPEGSSEYTRQMVLDAAKESGP